MRPAGRAAFAARTEPRPGCTPTSGHRVTREETARFRADEAAWADWQRRSASYRRTATHWIDGGQAGIDARAPAPTLIEDSRAGRPLKQLSCDRKSGQERGRRSPTRWHDLGALDLGDAFEPRAAEAIVGSGLHRLSCRRRGRARGSMAEAAEVLLALGARRRLDGAGVCHAGPRGRGAARRGGRAGGAPGRRLSGDRRGRGAAQQRRDRGRRRVAVTWRDPGDDRRGRASRRVAADRGEDLDHVAPEPDPRLRLAPR